MQCARLEQCWLQQHSAKHSAWFNCGVDHGVQHQSSLYRGGQPLSMHHGVQLPLLRLGVELLSLHHGLLQHSPLYRGVQQYWLLNGLQIHLLRCGLQHSMLCQGVKHSQLHCGM